MTTEESLRIENYQLKDNMRALQLDLTNTWKEFEYLAADTPPEFLYDQLMKIKRVIDARVMEKKF